MIALLILSVVIQGAAFALALARVERQQVAALDEFFASASPGHPGAFAPSSASGFAGKLSASTLPTPPAGA